MTTWQPLRIGLLLILLTGAVAAAAPAGDPPVDRNGQSKLLVVWTSGDRDVALKMVFMYTYNAKKHGWFDEIQLLVWGPSSRLLSQDRELQASIGKMKEAGVTLTACQACADLYGVADDLAALGIDVKYMGRPLTEMLQSDWKVITF